MHVLHSAGSEDFFILMFYSQLVYVLVDSESNAAVYLCTYWSIPNQTPQYWRTDRFCIKCDMVVQPSSLHHGISSILRCPSALMTIGEGLC